MDFEESLEKDLQQIAQDDPSQTDMINDIIELINAINEIQGR